MAIELGEIPRRIARALSWVLFAIAGALLAWFFVQPELADQELAGEQSRLVSEAIAELPQEGQVTTQSALAKLIPVDQVTRDGDVFAVLKIPRFGDDWQRFIGEGTRWETSLNTVGVGRYSNTSWPGDVGNFAVAGHRGGFGGSFRKINELKTGDIAEVRTEDSVFVYRFIEAAIVEPTAVGVIEDVPEVLSIARAGARYLTLTTCDPIWENTHRFIAWFELVETG